MTDVTKNNPKDRRLLVIITGADTPTGLTTVRSLDGVPVELWGVCSSSASQFCCSKLWHRLLVAEADPDKQLDLIEREVRAWKGEKPVLLFSQDDLVIAASRRRDTLGHLVRMPLPDAEATDLLMDKTRFHKWAEKNNVDVPYSSIVSTEEEFQAAAEKMEFPWILKPLVRMGKWNKENSNRKFFYIEEPADLKDLPPAPELFSLSSLFLVQEWIPGTDEDVYFCLFSIDEEGEILDSFLGRKIWQWPIGTGSTALCTDWSDVALEEKSRQIVLDAGMRGLGSVEFKRHSETGKYLVTEPTVGRNDYQSFCSVTAGHNMTAALVKHILSIPDELKPKRQPESIIWIDELAAYRRLAKLKFDKSLIILMTKLFFTKKKSFLVFSYKDFGPFSKLFNSLLKSRFRRNKK